MISVNGSLPTWSTFPNGEVTLKLDPSVDLSSSDVYVGWKFESNSDFLKLALLNSYIDEVFPDHLTVNCTILYMPYSRMDRSESKGPFSLDAVVGMLPSTWVYTVVEPHSDVTSNRMMFHGLTSFSTYPSLDIADLVLNGVTPGFQEEPFCNDDTVIVFPDKGAYNRYIGLIGGGSIGYATIVYGEKSRDFTPNFEDSNISGLSLVDHKGEPVARYDIEKNPVLIVDDLSSYGGTFKRVATLVKELGASCVGLIVTHAEDSIFKGDLLNHVDHIYTTDSMLSYNLKPEKVTVIPLKEISDYVY